jgi:hypothetical protein
MDFGDVGIPIGFYEAWPNGYYYVVGFLIGSMEFRTSWVECLYFDGLKSGIVGADLEGLWWSL